MWLTFLKNSAYIYFLKNVNHCDSNVPQIVDKFWTYLLFKLAFRLPDERSF